MLSPELLHHLPLVLLLLPPNILQIFLSANPGTPEIDFRHCHWLTSMIIRNSLEVLPCFFHHNGREFVVFHAPVIKVLISVFSLIIPAQKRQWGQISGCISPEYATNLFADINLGIAVINEVVKLGVIFLLTLAFYSVFPTPTSFTSLERRQLFKRFWSAVRLTITITSSL